VDGDLREHAPWQFELHWTRQRARRTAWRHVVACTLGASASAASMVASAAWLGLDPEPSVQSIAVIAGTWVCLGLGVGFLVLGRAAVTELRAADAGSLRMCGAELVEDDATHRVIRATTASGRVTLALAGAQQRVVSLDRRRHRALVRHLRSVEVEVARGLGEREILVGVPVLVGAVLAVLGAGALLEAAVTVAVLWLAVTAPALFALLLAGGLLGSLGLLLARARRKIKGPRG
jgi:hypothetical protein